MITTLPASSQPVASASTAFDLSTPGFSLANARACASWSRAAYLADSVPLQGVTRQCQSEKAHCLVVTSPLATDHLPLATILFAFRGTNNPLDFLTDAEAWFHPTTHGRVHHGFDESLITIREQLLAEIPRDFAGRIFITGHSKGGAEALLFAHSLLATGHCPLATIHCYTFGQPRVGDRAFAQSCDHLFSQPSPNSVADSSPRFSNLHPQSSVPTHGHWRFVNRADIVPRLAGYLYGYRHSGQEAFHPLLGRVSFATPLWLKLLTDVAVLCQEWQQGRLALLNDHHIDLYHAWLSTHTPV